MLLGSRNVEHGEAAAKSVGASARALQLDVTNDASIAAAAERIRNELGRLDVLVNNAAISNTQKPDMPFQEILKAGRASAASLAEVRAVFETNVFAVIAVTQAMLPLLREAPAGRIVNVSSEVGSLTRQSDPSNPHRSQGVAYAPSKSCPQRDHARLRERARDHAHQGERGVPGLHRDGPEQVQRHAHRGAGRTRAGASRAPRREWTDGQLLEPVRPSALVSLAAVLLYEMDCSMAAIRWWMRLIAFSGLTMTLKSTIWPDSFHLMRSTPLTSDPVDLGLELEHGV